MKSKIPIFLFLLSLLISCLGKSRQGSPEQWKKEILETEKEFAGMAKDAGIREAFLAYAAEDAVLMRGNTLVQGKEKITEYFNNQAQVDSSMSLTWKPEFVEVAASGDLGYTYGTYTFSYTDSTGSRIDTKGVFHTVWKKQADGTWRFVWD